MNFFWSPFPGKQSAKIRGKFGENSEQNSGGNSGQKFEKFGELSFCHFSDLTNSALVGVSGPKNIFSSPPAADILRALYPHPASSDTPPPPSPYFQQKPIPPHTPPARTSPPFSPPQNRNKIKTYPKRPPSWAPPWDIPACAMTTKFLNNINLHFQNFTVMAVPRKKVFWMIFLSAPNAPHPSKPQTLF